jgi:hypothetical protein
MLISPEVTTKPYLIGVVLAWCWPVPLGFSVAAIARSSLICGTAADAHRWRCLPSRRNASYARAEGMAAGPLFCDFTLRARMPADITLAGSPQGGLPAAVHVPV